MNEVLKLKKLNEDAILPLYSHKEDAGMDLFSTEEVVIPHGSWALVKTGISIELPHGYEAQVRSKSGLALKSGIFVLNSPGTVDENYRGEICVILMNMAKEDYKVEKNQKVAQMVISKVEHLEIALVDEMSKTSRGEGGFGSTGLSAK